ncbi:MAG: ABC transporter permease [Rhizobacter sp.]
MSIFSLALRNVLRNRRRTVLTLAALGVAATAMVMLGGYVSATIKGLQTSTVRQTGHLQIMVRGYLDFGRGNPSGYAIRDVDELVTALKSDAVLKPWVQVVTPVLHVQGVAGQFASGLSSNFVGSAWVPQDRSNMLAWDGQNMRFPPAANHLRQDQPESGVIGVGLAQLLGLCDALEVKQCARPPTPAAATGPRLADDLALLSQQVRTDTAAPTTSGDEVPIELLSSSQGGAPNVIRMNVTRAELQGVRDVDRMYVGLPLALAQRLVFGSDPAGASALVVQLHRTADMPLAKQRIEALLASRMSSSPTPGIEGNEPQDLEVREFQDVAASYNQVVGMFKSMFGFVSLLMAVVTVFSVANTVNMAVSERTAEIGTLQAMGLKQRDIRRLFVAEGGLIGVGGAVFGVVLALLVAQYGINPAGLQWTPPGNSSAVPVGIDVAGSGMLCLGVVLTLTKIACLSSWWPAHRASQMEIVEALRHA